MLIGEYADEETAIEAMRSLMRLIQARDETPEELRTRTTKLAALAFPEEVK